MEVLTDLFQAGPFAWPHDQYWASNTGVTELILIGWWSDGFRAW